ncbi:hypothetical protein BTA51_04400 [Hahella sp. CCB-MM4]|uniref:helix-turn-helix domain-containing protein n=1 Tax=Hahella sp. (strain CCB-MM4) TaxID=1926491 RepID=UPI000B9A54EA|nr:helix-turn-helix domain-containing protein [Hahella sp. CCB-MM4]OZG74263.1 hypothetical protein BTA51_04400 [Hahella sp. CCB-MM4]
MSRQSTQDDPYAKVSPGTSCERIEFYFGSPEEMHYSHQHSHLELNILLVGQLEVTYADEDILLTAGSIACFSALHPHWLHSISGDALSLQLRIPLFTLPCLPDNELFRQFLIRTTPYISDISNLVHLSTAERWAQELACKDDRLQELVIDEIGLMLRRLLVDTPYSEAAQGHSKSLCRHLVHSHNMVEFIIRNYRQPITINDIAESVGLHRNFAMNVFKKSVGMSLLEYLTSLRVNHARRLLLHTRDQVTNIAFDSGFTSITRFYEVFSKYYRESPLQYRKQHSLLEQT